MRNHLSVRYYYLLWVESINRDKFPGEIPDGDTLIPAWVRHERLILLEDVNKMRSERGLLPVTEEAIKQGEFAGDAYYWKRLADCCARLALGEE